MAWLYSDGDHNGGLNAREVRKITIFDQYLTLAFISEMIQDRAVLMADLQWSIERRHFQ